MAVLEQQGDTLLLPKGRREESVQDRSLTWQEIVDADPTWLVDSSIYYSLPGIRPRYEMIYMLALNNKLSNVNYEWLTKNLGVLKVIDSGERFSSDTIELRRRSGLLELVNKFPLQTVKNLGSIASDRFEVTMYPHLEELISVVEGRLSSKFEVDKRRKVVQALRAKGHGSYVTAELIEDAYNMISSEYFGGDLSDWVKCCWHDITFSVGSGERIHGTLSNQDNIFKIMVSRDTMIKIQDPDPMVSMMLTLEHELSHLIVNVWTHITGKYAEAHGSQFKNIMNYYFGQAGASTHKSFDPSKGETIQSLSTGDLIKSRLKVGDLVKINWTDRDIKKFGQLETTGRVNKKNPLRATLTLADGKIMTVGYERLTLIER